jgi:hypothetical protein
MSEEYDAAKSVSVLLMGINQKQLIAVWVLDRKIIQCTWCRPSERDKLECNRLSIVFPTEAKLLLLCLAFVFACGFVQFCNRSCFVFCAICVLFYCACWAVCLVCVFCLFWYSLFSKQLAINSYIPFNNSI